MNNEKEGATAGLEVGLMNQSLNHLSPLVLGYLRDCFREEETLDLI